MKTVAEVFDAAMALMDELPNQHSGGAGDADRLEYLKRTPAILNALTGELFILTGGRGLVPVEGPDNALVGIEDVFAVGAMQYGLAANLLIDENPSAAAFYEQRYEELRDRYVRTAPAAVGEIENVYGGIEHGEYGRW